MDLFQFIDDSYIFKENIWVKILLFKVSNPEITILYPFPTLLNSPKIRTLQIQKYTLFYKIVLGKNKRRLISLSTEFKAPTALDMKLFEWEIKPLSSLLKHVTDVV